MCKNLRSPDLHTKEHAVWLDYFHVGGNSRFCQVVGKRIFPGVGQQWWNFILPTWN